MSPRVAVPAPRTLVEIAGSLAAERDPEVMFDELLGAARFLTGARYSALGVLNERRDGLSSFRTAGVDQEFHRAIAQPPRGRGVLGILIRDAQPLRLRDVARHPSSYGFPQAHPVMRSFLGVPVSVRGVVWANLYLADKAGGAFTEADQDIAVVLADCAAAAIAAVRLAALPALNGPNATAGSNERSG